jgi:ketosteroid isomerase-like protein
VRGDPRRSALNETAVHGILDAYFGGLDGEDWASLAALFADDAELVAPGAHRRGAAAVAQYFRDALAPYPDHHDRPGRRFVAGSTATVEIHFSGRMANGAAIEFDAVDVFELHDGRITRLTSWYDSHEVRRSLLAGRARGGGPEAGAAALALACRALRGHAPLALGGRWHGTVPAALSLPATVLDADGELRADRMPAEVAGRALLLRGVASCDPGLLAGAAAVATDGLEPLGDAPLRGTGFALDAIAPGDGVLVSAPGADGSAHAALLR